MYGGVVYAVHCTQFSWDNVGMVPSHVEPLG